MKKIYKEKIINEEEWFYDMMLKKVNQIQFKGFGVFVGGELRSFFIEKKYCEDYVEDLKSGIWKWKYNNEKIEIKECENVWIEGFMIFVDEKFSSFYKNENEVWHIYENYFSSA